VLSTAQRHTAFLDDPRVIGTLKSSNLNFQALKASPVPTDVYLCIPPDKLRAFHRYVRGMLGLAFRAMLTERQQSKHPVLFLLDEFASLGHFKAAEDAVTLLRGYGVQLWLLVQDLSQLQSVYPKWRSFLANTTLQAFGTQDLDTAKYLSEMLGHETIEVETKSASVNRSWSMGDHGNQGRTTSTQATARALLTPDEVRRLEPWKVLVLEQGQSPAMLQALNYLVDEETQGRFEKNPMHRVSA